MTAEPQEESVDQLSGGTQVEGEQPDADAIVDNHARVGRRWVPPLSPAQGEQLVKVMLPHVSGINAFQQQVGKSLSTIAATVIDLNKFTQPMLASVQTSLSRLVDLSDGLKRLADKLPPNWRGPLRFELLFQVIQVEGIPLVWVPQARIVRDLLAAPDRNARIAILTARCSDVVQDCRQALDEITRPDLVRLLPMARSALDAYADGYYAPAQALSVTIVETVVKRTIGGYQEAQTFAKIDDPEELGIEEIRFRAALAPIGPFYTPWWPSSGNPMPDELSRHVTVHQAGPAHYTHGNATIAIMLLASVLRGVEEYLNLTTPATS